MRTRRIAISFALFNILVLLAGTLLAQLLFLPAAQFIAFIAARL